MPKDTEFLPFEIILDGKLNTADSPLTIGKNFSTLENMRYDDKMPKSVGGMTKINSTNPLDSDHQHVQNAFHFHKDSPAESHVLVQTVDTSDANPAIVQNTTAIPIVGDFEGGATNTDLYIEDTSAGVARFSDAPNGQVVICDGKESLIWGGDESKVGASLTSTATITTALTTPRDYSSKVQNSSQDADQRLLLGSVDTDTVLLLHCDGADASTTFTDSSATPHTVTAVGNAQLDVDQVKFSTASGLLDGTGDYLTVPDHADFDFSGKLFTVDLWVKLNAGATEQTFFSQSTNASSHLRCSVLYSNPSGDSYSGQISIKHSGSSYNALISGTTGFNSWHHVAFVFDGTNQEAFWDGVKKSSTVSPAIPNHTSLFTIGAFNDNVNPISLFLDGHIDEFRVSNGVARWSSDFTPLSLPYGAYGSDFLVGSTRPLKGCKFYIPSGNGNITTSTLTMKEWNGNSWSDVTITDNTDTGASLAQTGTVTWASTVNTSKVRYFEGYLLYWYNFTLSAGDVEIYQITVDTPVQKCLDIWDGQLRTIFSYQIFFTPAYNDNTVNVSDDSYDTGNTATYAVLSSLATATDYQYIGSLERLAGLEIHLISAQTNATAGVLTCAYWNGSAWTDTTNLIDGTTEGGATFAKSGVITWQVPDEVVEFKTQIGAGIPLYFYRLHSTGDFDASVQVYYIAGIPTQNRVGNYRFPMLADNCLWLCDDIDGQRNGILRSAPDAPDVFNGTESFRINFGDEKKLICSTVLNTRKENNIFDVKLMFKSNQTYGLTGYSQDTYQTFEISRTIGCVAPLTLKTSILESEGNIFPVAIWQGAGGIYIYNDFKPVPISMDIRNFFDKNESNTRKLHASYIGNSVGFVDEEKREYHWKFADGSSTGTLNREFVFDLRRFKWFEIDRGTGKYLQCGITVEDTNGNNYNYGFLDTGYMERLEDGTDFDGTDIVSTVQIGDGALYKDSSMYQTIVRYFKLIMKAKTTTANEVTVTHYGDGNSTGTVMAKTFDPTKSGYDFVNIDHSVNLGNYNHHSFKLSMTTDDENVGFEPIRIGGFYKVVREDKR